MMRCPLEVKKFTKKMIGSNYSRTQTKHLRTHTINDILFKRGKTMALSYNKLWKLLIDKNMSKTKLRELSGVSQSTLAKLSKGENVNTEILERICIALNCEIEDIVEIKKEF